MVLLLCMVFISVATGCSSASKSEDLKSSSLHSESTADQSTAAAPAESKAEMAANTDANADTIDAESTKSALGAGADRSLSPSMDQRKLIYQANVTMEVKDYGKAQTELQNKIQLAGGICSSSQIRRATMSWEATLLLKYPRMGSWTS